MSIAFEETAVYYVQATTGCSVLCPRLTEYSEYIRLFLICPFVMCLPVLLPVCLCVPCLPVCSMFTCALPVCPCAWMRETIQTWPVVSQCFPLNANVRPWAIGRVCVCVCAIHIFFSYVECKV